MFYCCFCYISSENGCRFYFYDNSRKCTSLIWWWLFHCKFRSELRMKYDFHVPLFPSICFRNTCENWVSNSTVQLSTYSSQNILLLMSDCFRSIQLFHVLRLYFLLDALFTNHGPVLNIRCKLIAAYIKSYERRFNISAFLNINLLYR